MCLTNALCGRLFSVVAAKTLFELATMVSLCVYVRAFRYMYVYGSTRMSKCRGHQNIVQDGFCGKC